MSRIRTIKPEWRTDERLKGASDEARVLSVALITLADDYGNGEAGDLVIAGAVWGGFNPRESLAKASRAIRELVANGYVTVYEVSKMKYFHINNWAKHQRVDKPGKPQFPGLERGDIIEINPRESFANHSRIIRESFATDQDQDQDQDQEGDQESASPNSAMPPRKSTRTPQVTEMAREAASFLLQQRVQRDPKAKAGRNPERTVASWGSEMDKIHRIDGRDWEEVMRVLRWSQEDDFWAANIQSAAKFRQKFETLREQMSRKAKNSSRGLSFEDLAKMGGFQRDP